MPYLISQLNVTDCPPVLPKISVLQFALFTEFSMDIILLEFTSAYFSYLLFLISLWQPCELEEHGTILMPFVWVLEVLKGARSYKICNCHCDVFNNICDMWENCRVFSSFYGKITFNWCSLQKFSVSSIRFSHIGIYKCDVYQMNILCLCLQVITEYVYSLLETEVGLQRMMVPQQGAVQKSAVIFVSSDALSQPDRLLVLIPGSGVVKSGQWARR